MTSKSVKIGEGEWVVVCDGCKALFLQNAGDSKFPNLQMREVLEQKVPPTSEIGTDAPGRSHSSVGHGRSSVEQTDFHTQQEDEFLRGIMTKLDTAVQAGAAQRRRAPLRRTRGKACPARRSKLGCPRWTP